MNLEEITTIEEYVQKNLIEWIKKDKTYSEQANNFKFLPGHKAALVALPDIVNDYIATYQQSNSKKKRYNLGNNPRKNGDLDEDTPTVIETVEINITEEDQQALQSSLIKKVEKYAKNILKKSDLKLPQQNISSLDVCLNKAGAIIHKCSVLCTNCDIKTVCSFNKTWQVSNFEKHLKDCYLGKRPEKPLETLSNHSLQEKSSEKTIVEKPIQENAHDLDSLLNKTSDELVDELNKSLQDTLKISKN